MSHLKSPRSHAIAACVVAFVAVSTLATRPNLLTAANSATMAEPNVVKGTVRTVAGRPIAGATIRIAGATGAARGTSITATSDRSGNYRVRVPLGHYNVDAFADIDYDGQTYRELWLHRVNGGCDRAMSDKGIVRDFVLRLSGPKQCFNTPDRNNPGSYYGAYLIALTSAFPADAVITFTLAPLGPLADGSAGRPITFTRTGAALARGGGAIDHTSFLYDVPLGRYRLTADARYADGSRRSLSVDSRDDDMPEAAAVDIAFPAARMGGGFRSVNLGISASGGGRAPAPTVPSVRPATPVSDSGTESAVPDGRYICSYRSPYAGDIPTGNTVMIMADGRYEAYGSAGTYSADARTGGVRWISGPLAGSDTRATFARSNGRPTITVVGGAASADPDRTHTCVLTDS